MSVPVLLKKVLGYAGHKSGCGALGVMWDQSPCDCGWEALRKELMREGVIPAFRKCEHCGNDCGPEELPSMGVCAHCARLLCLRCLTGVKTMALRYESGTCHQSPTKHHERGLPKEGA